MYSGPAQCYHISILSGSTYLSILVAEEDNHPVVGNLVLVVDRHDPLVVDILGVVRIRPAVAVVHSHHRTGLAVADHIDRVVGLEVVRNHHLADHSCLVVGVETMSARLAYRKIDQCCRGAI